MGESFAPVICNSVGKDVTRMVEGSRHNRTTNFRIALEAVFSILVPEVIGAVAACGAEGTVNRVPRDGVDTVDPGQVAIGSVLLTMALEGEIGALILIIDVLHGAATFNASYSKSGGVQEAANDACLPL